jgi:putative membrane protein
MIAAHLDSSRELADAAMRAGMKVPAGGLSGDQAQFLNALQSQKGREFDKTYAKQQVLAHRSALAVQQQFASVGDQGDLKKAAAAAVPIITAHLAMAEQLQARLGDD